MQKLDDQQESGWTGKNSNKSTDRSMEVLLSGPFRKPTNQTTYQPTDGQDRVMLSESFTSIILIDINL